MLQACFLVGEPGLREESHHVSWMAKVRHAMGRNIAPEDSLGARSSLEKQLIRVV